MFHFQFYTTFSTFIDKFNRSKYLYIVSWKRYRNKYVERQGTGVRMGNRLKGMFRGMSVSFAACLLMLSALSVYTAPAATLAEKQAEAQRIQQQLDAMKKDSERLASEYSASLNELESIRFVLAENRHKLEKAQEEYQNARRVLQSRLRSMYMLGDINAVEVLLESSSVGDLLSRYEFLRYLSEQDIDVFKQIRSLRSEIALRQRELEDQERRQGQALAGLHQKQLELQNSLAAQQKLLDSVNAEIKTLLDQMTPTSGGGGSGGNYVIGSFVFPVRGPHTFTNDWHAPRTGHLHQGCDVFASTGTPCVAVVSGTASTGEGKNAGYYIRLSGDDGNVYYYMHLDRFGQTGRVAAGTVIGYVGDTGNAKGGPPHLHFEIHPGGGAAINPYPILKAHDR
jgi:murein DD-endopeptidase MepM/ murein hydrolase activator NlpD